MASRENPYESERYTSEYLLFHYGKPEDLCPYPFVSADALNFHSRIVREMIKPIRKTTHSTGKTRALDLGCAVGRISFELSLIADEVLGVDFSEAFISAARGIAGTGSADFEVVVEGDLRERRHVTLDEKYHVNHVQFEVGDAQRLPSDLGEFDVAVLANLIDRLPDPRRCLEQLPRLIRKGGQLVVTSPYSWMEQYTPKSKWLGGHQRDNEPVRTLDGLGEVLRPHFEVFEKRELPFLIREHGRKYQLVIAQATTWIKQ